MFAPMKSMSSSKQGDLGSKLGHQVKSKENILNTLEVTFFQSIPMNLAQNVCLDDIYVSLETGSLGIKN